MNIRRIITAAMLAAAVSVTPVMAAEFTDTSGHWAESIIDELADKGIVSGVSADKFNPDGTVTRAEFYRMAQAAMNIEPIKYRGGECLNIKKTAWYADTMQSALDRGLIPEAMIDDYSVEVVIDENGSKAVYGGKLDAEKAITREEMAYVAQAAYQYSLGEDGLEELSVPMDLDFVDTSAISAWAMNAVKHAYVNGLVAGMDDGTFAPHNTATRAQAATIIKNMIDQ